MEGASRQLTGLEWTVDEVSKKIREKFNEEVAKKFEGKLHICGKYILKWYSIVDCQCQFFGSTCQTFFLSCSFLTRL